MTLYIIPTKALEKQLPAPPPKKKKKNAVIGIVLAAVHLCASSYHDYLHTKQRKPCYDHCIYTSVYHRPQRRLRYHIHHHTLVIIEKAHLKIKGTVQ